MRNIPLKNGKIAVYKAVKRTEHGNVFVYNVPCSSCSFQSNTGYAYDQQVFMTYQISCKECGIYYRPVPDPKYIEVDRIKQPPFAIGGGI